MLRDNHDNKTPAQEAYAKELIVDEDATPEALYNAFLFVFGERTPSYEPDTIRKAAKDFGFEVPETNFDKFQAVNTLLSTTAFFWDVNTFEQILRAFNNLEIDVDVLHGAHPSYLGWGCTHALHLAKAGHIAHPVEGAMIDYIDYEPLEYVVTMLLEHGFVVPPTGLGWAQERLDEHCKSHCDLKNDVLKRWLALSKSTLSDTSFEETPVGVQLARLAGCELYFREKEKQAAQELSKLRAPE